MSKAELVEIPFGPEDFESSLEDEFTLTRIKAELEAVTDIEQLRVGAIKLLQLAVMRQAMIRGLIRRLSKFEIDAMRSTIPD